MCLFVVTNRNVEKLNDGSAVCSGSEYLNRYRGSINLEEKKNLASQIALLCLTGLPVNSSEYWILEESLKKLTDISPYSDVSQEPLIYSYYEYKKPCNYDYMVKTRLPN